MWWQPFDEQSEILNEHVEELTGAFRQYLREAADQPGDRAVWGVGSAPDPTGAWINELILVEAAILQSTPADGGRYSAEELFHREPNLAHVLDAFPIWPTTFVDVTTRPLAATKVQVPDLVRESGASNRTATVGLPCMLTATNTAAFITAGHLVKGARSPVDILATGHGGSRWIRGEVVLWEDPGTTPGVAGHDYAVVKLLDDNAQILGLTHAGVAGAPTPPYSPINVAAYSAISGNQYGQISGALTQLGDATRQWLSCWQIAPSSLLTLGDSGSAVLGTSGVHSGKVLGHFVGGSIWHRRPGLLIHQYVQDLDACLSAGLRQHIRI
ncbi:hypothetical protein ACFYSW_27680 [Rhodococcus aetherivorans]|uniref:hypothetical protein n=1 Tax=Rhodococcus aetherivorans TaxID=191292 RepID=UPI0036A19586